MSTNCTKKNEGGGNECRRYSRKRVPSVLEETSAVGTAQLSSRKEMQRNAVQCNTVVETHTTPRARSAATPATAVSSKPQKETNKRLLYLVSDRSIKETPCATVAAAAILYLPYQGYVKSCHVGYGTYDMKQQQCILGKVSHFRSHGHVSKSLALVRPPVVQYTTSTDLT